MGFIVSASMFVGNFVYQATRLSPDWEAALERSAFQAFAVVTYWLATRKPLKEQ
ncbi:MAG: hypothetical protein AB7I50_00640 [Vicinamibacterales bacterium]